MWPLFWICPKYKWFFPDPYHIFHQVLWKSDQYFWHNLAYKQTYKQVWTHNLLVREIKKMFSLLIFMQVEAVLVLWVHIYFSFSSTRTKLHSFTNHSWSRISDLHLCFTHIWHLWNNSSGQQHRSRGTGPPGQWRKQLLLWQSRDLPPWTVGDGVWWPLGPGWCSGGVQTAGLWQGPVSTTKCTVWTGQWTHLVGRCCLLWQRIKANRVPAPRDWISRLWSQWGCWCRLWR